MNLSENTIISFASLHPLREMCIPGANTETGASDEQPHGEQQFKLRLVNSEGRREAASLLIQKMYSWRGYAIDHPLGTEPDKITLAVDAIGATVGTMTLCFDTDIGLPADENFQNELDALRAQGSRLCEPSRLAIDVSAPKRVFAAMIHLAYLYAHRIHGFTDWVIEVNPRHAIFYKRMLGFCDYGKERICTRVNAPAVLLRLELKHMAEKIQQFGGLMEKKHREKSFYPYFFGSRDEQGITARLKAEEP